MSIIYTLVAKGDDKVLCEYTDYHGNFEQVSRSLLKKVQKDHRATFSYDDAFYFHYSNSKNITFMCMCDNKYPSNSAFLFLEQIKHLFFQIFLQKEIDNAISYSLNDSFKDTLKNKLEYFNKNPQEGMKNPSQSQSISQSDSNSIEVKEMIPLTSNDSNTEYSDTVAVLPPSSQNFINLVVKRAQSVKSERETCYGNERKSFTSCTRKEVRVNRLKLILVGILMALFIGYFTSILFCGIDYEGCRSE